MTARWGVQAGGPLDQPLCGWLSTTIRRTWVARRCLENAGYSRAGPSGTAADAQRAPALRPSRLRIGTAFAETSIQRGAVDRLVLLRPPTRNDRRCGAAGGRGSPQGQPLESVGGASARCQSRLADPLVRARANRGQPICACSALGYIDRGLELWSARYLASGPLCPARHIELTS